MKLNVGEFVYLARCLQGIFFGIYSGIFAMYLQSRNKDRNILFYGLCVLYALCGACFVINTALDAVLDKGLSLNIGTVWFYLSSIAFCCSDFISQSILIYRCWIVWCHNLRVVIIPSLLAFSFLIIWIAGTVPPAESLVHGRVLPTALGNALGLTALAISTTVNAVATGLIVCRIFKVFREVKTGANDQTLGVTDGITLRSIMFVIIESGTALLFCQIIRFALGLQVTFHPDAAANVYYIFASLQTVLNGITPTIILVRVSMGLSFHDEDSFVEASIGSLCFFPQADADVMPEAGSIGIVD